MPRKNPVAEIQNEEEAAPSSPSLRRSSRLSISSAAPAAAAPPPTKVATRRNSSVESATVTPKATRTRRASAVQDVEPKEVEVVKKAAAKTAAPSTPSRRGRKPSVSAAIIEEKAVTAEEDVAEEESAKKATKPVVSTPSRRGRKSIVPQIEEEPKKTPLRRGRKASTAEAVEAEDPAPVVVADPKKTRSSTAAKATIEVKKPTTRRTSVTIEEPAEKSDEPVSKVRKTAKQTTEGAIEKTPVAARTRRSIVDKRVATPVKKSPNESLILDPKSLEPITEKVSPAKAPLAVDDEDESPKDTKVEEEEIKQPEKEEEEKPVTENEGEVTKKKEEQEKPISEEIILENQLINEEEKMEVEDIPEKIVEHSETPVQQPVTLENEKVKEIESEEKQETAEPTPEETPQLKAEEAIEAHTEKVSEKTEDVFKKPSEVKESKILVVENTKKSVDASSSFDSFHLEISGSILDSTSQENSEIDNKHIASEANESTPKNKTDSTDFELLDVSLVLKSTDYKKPPQLPLPEVEKELEITKKLNDEMAEFLEEEINQGKQEVQKEESKEEKVSVSEKESEKQKDVENEKVEEKQSEPEEFNNEESIESPEMEPLEVTEAISYEESKDNTVEESFKDEDKSKTIQNKSVESLDENTDLIDDSQSDSISESSKKRKSIEADLPIKESLKKKSKTEEELEIESKISEQIQDVEPMEVDSFIETEIVNKSVTEPAQSDELNKTAKQTETEEEIIENSVLNETVQDKEKSIISAKNPEDFLSLNKTIDHEEVIGNITLNQSTFIELPFNTPAKKIDSSVQEKSAVEQLEKSISVEKPSLHVSSISKEKLDATLDLDLLDKSLEIYPSPKKVPQEEVAKQSEEVKKQEVIEEKKKVIVEFIADLPIEVVAAPKVLNIEPEVEKKQAETPVKAALEAKDESEPENITIEETINGSSLENEDSSDDEDDIDYVNFLKQSEKPMETAELNSTELSSSDESYQPENSVVLDDTIEDEDDEADESFVAEHEISIVSNSSDIADSKRVLRKSSAALSTRIIDSNNENENNSPSKKEKEGSPSKNVSNKKTVQEDANLVTESSEKSKDDKNSPENSNKQSSTEKPSIDLQEKTTEITEEDSEKTGKDGNEQENNTIITIDDTIDNEDSLEDEEDEVYKNFLKQSGKSMDTEELNSSELVSSDESYQPENSTVVEDTTEDEDDEDEASLLNEPENVMVDHDAGIFYNSSGDLSRFIPARVETRETIVNRLTKKVIEEELISLIESSEDESSSTSNKQSSEEQQPSVVIQENGTESQIAPEINEAGSSAEKSQDNLDASSDSADKSTDSAPETPNEEIKDDGEATTQANKGSKRRKLYHSGCYDLDKALAPTPVKSSEPTGSGEKVEVKAAKTKKEPKVGEKENIEKVVNNDSKKSNATAGKSSNKKKVLKPSVEPPTTDWNVLPVPAIKPSTRNTVTPKKEKEDGK